MKSIKMGLIGLGAAVASFSASAAPVTTCGSYTIYADGTCLASFSDGVASGLTATFAPGGGALDLLTLGGVAVGSPINIDGNGGSPDPLPQPPNTISYTGPLIDPTMSYLLFVMDTPPNQWAVTEVLGSVFLASNGGLLVSEASATGNYKYAVFGAPPTSVPLPGALSLIGLGLCLMGLRSRKAA